MKLEHVAINVSDPKALAAWFADNFGMRIVMAQDEAPFMHFVTDDSGSMLEFYHNPAAPLPDYANIDPVNLHIAFASNDIAADRERLLAAGASPVGEINTNATGAKLAFFRAPNQVPFQLVQRLRPLT
jgi:glyoxylase I family protein